MPYRGRAVKRVKGQRNLKPNAPLVKFTLTKQYVVSKQALQSSYSHMIRVNAATPFDPINTIHGSWNSDSITQEPMGLDSDLYTHYKFLHVHACNASVSVQDCPDTQPGEDESLTQGAVSIIRSSENALPSTESAAIKQMYGQKTRQFQLSPRLLTSGGETGLANNVLTKSAYVSNGYSAKRQFNQPADFNQDLSVENLSGSAHVPNDSTYLFIVVRPQTDNFTDYLLPTTVRVRLTYIIRFSDPTQVQSVPLPMSGYSRSRSRRQAVPYRKAQQSITNKVQQTMANAAAQTILGMAGFQARQRAIRY